MSELKPYFRAVGQAHQSVEQIADLAFQFEVIAASNRPIRIPTAEVRNLNNSHLVIELRLPASNGQVLDSPELVSLHQLQ